MDRLHDVFIGEIDDDDLLIDDLFIEKGEFFSLPADIVPNTVIERALGRWRSQDFGDLFPGMFAENDLGELCGARQIAPDGEPRRARRQGDGQGGDA